MSGLLGGLLQGAVQVRGAMLRGQAEGEELVRQREQEQAREERLRRAQEAAAELSRLRAQVERSKAEAHDRRERERATLDEQTTLGNLAARGVFRGHVPTDPKEPGRYRDVGGGMYYDGHFSPEHRAQLAGASRLAATIAARRNAKRTEGAGPSAHFRGANAEAVGRRAATARREQYILRRVPQLMREGKDPARPWVSVPGLARDEAVAAATGEYEAATGRAGGAPASGTPAPPVAPVGGGTRASAAPPASAARRVITADQAAFLRERKGLTDAQIRAQYDVR